MSEYKWSKYLHGDDDKCMGDPLAFDSLSNVFIDNPIDASLDKVVIAETQQMVYFRDNKLEMHMRQDDMARRIAAALNFFDGVPIEAIDALNRSRVDFEHMMKEKDHANIRKLVDDALGGMNDENDNNPR